MADGSAVTASIGTLQVGTDLRVTDFLDDAATPGDRTVNRLSGRNAIAGTASNCTITNSKVTANSQIVVTLETTNDATLTHLKGAIPGSGTFTVYGNAASTGNCTFRWTVINP